MGASRAKIFACGVFASVVGCAKGGAAPADAPPGSVGDGPDGSVDVDAPAAIDAPVMPDAPFGSLTVTITPTMPRTLDDLTAMIVIPPNPPSYTVHWSKSGVLQPNVTGTVVGNALTAKGELWAIDLVDATSQSLAHAEVTIANTPPTAPTAQVPSGLAPSTPIQCLLAGGATDADGDAITYTATWTRNGVAFGGATTTALTGDTIPFGVSALGDTFACTITASDGTATASSAAVSTQPTCVGHVPAATTYNFASGSQFYQVPICATHLTIETWGAQGGGVQGGRGGYARGTIDLPVNQLLLVEVGGTNGYNGGGPGMASTNVPNGGGASDVRLGDDQLTSRILVAGGGGGGPTVDQAWIGGAGGGGICGANYCGGGAGNGYGGTPGSQMLATPGGAAGGAAFQTAHGGGGGGGGASSGGGGSCQTANPPNTCAGSGGFGFGGAGAGGGNPFCYSSYGGTAGGGGGYYGGGGTAVGYCGGGSGGGGSSWTGSLANPVMTPGVQAGNGMVVITPS